MPKAIINFKDGTTEEFSYEHRDFDEENQMILQDDDEETIYLIMLNEVKFVEFK